jgi:hypothetical protein
MQYEEKRVPEVKALLKSHAIALQERFSEKTKPEGIVISARKIEKSMGGKPG